MIPTEGLFRNVVQLSSVGQLLTVVADGLLAHPEGVGDRLLRHALRPQARLLDTFGDRHGVQQCDQVADRRHGHHELTVEA